MPVSYSFLQRKFKYESSTDTKWGGNFDEEQDIFMVFKYLPIDCLLVPREKNSDHIVKDLETTLTEWWGNLGTKENLNRLLQVAQRSQDSIPKDWPQNPHSQTMMLHYLPKKSDPKAWLSYWYQR